MVLPVRKTKKARIEIIPMIDVVFFLLVFFMMASLAMSVSAMPTSSASAPPPGTSGLNGSTARDRIPAASAGLPGSGRKR